MCQAADERCRPPARTADVAGTLARIVGAAVIVMWLAGCSGLYLGDNPGPDVAKQTGPLTDLPAHLRRGGE